MPTKDALAVFLESLARKTYYEILRIEPTAGRASIKEAFYDFSLLYHPDRYVDSPPEVAAVAQDVFKRGVEAYRCLSRPASRQRYDRALGRGQLRLDGEIPSAKPPPPAARTLETVARSKRAQEFARKADRLLAIGKLDDARVQLVSACQCEPDNDELAERLQILYEALALEPP
ncbi:MAG TPA: J domain-containing protein [Polyangiaceae bacterium]|nr:J domain-containing protein [Polyangiaceae bacterium]